MQTIRKALYLQRSICFLFISILLCNTTVSFAYAVDVLTSPPSYHNSFTHLTEDSENRFSESEKSELNKVVESSVSSTSMMVSSSTQPEVSGFSIGSTDGMVDKFTGDFSYSIPLVDAEGYPIVLSYSSTISMLDEASWVGLGWNLNVGAIVRDARGIPDDFNGDDIITREFKQKDNAVEGSKNGGYLQLGVGFGDDSQHGIGVGISFLAGKYTDNYLGIGKTYDLNIGGSARYAVQSNGEGGGLFLIPSINWGMSYDSKNGIGSTFGFGMAAMGNSGGDSKLTGGTLGMTYGRNKNSRSGLNSQSFSLSAKVSHNKKVSEKFKYGVGAGAASTSTFTYGSATSLPRVHFNSSTSSSNFELDVYAGFNFEIVKFRVGSLHQIYSTSSQILYHSGNKIFHPAYGYFHSGKRIYYSGDYFPMMDFNRGIENEYSEEMRSLPFSVQTHDVFYVNGAGVNGTYRGMRSDYGTYYDPESESTYNNDSQLLVDDNVSTLATGVDFKIKPTPSFGFGLEYTTATMKAEQASGSWKHGVNLLEFKPQSPSSNFDETVYFKGMGSLSPVDMTSWNYMNGNTADYFNINASGGQIIQQNLLKVKNYDNAISAVELNGYHQTTYSSVYFNPNTVAQLIAPGTTAIQQYYESVSPMGDRTPIYRSSVDKKGNHISAIDVVNENGAKYQYGIPVYSYKKEEVTFSCEGRPELPENGVPSGIIKYETGDNSLANNLGRGSYFDKTTMPPHAQAFLLTQVVSSDYVDLLGDGPTPDDVGNYHKFNYTRVYGNNAGNMYGTRFPISGTNASEKKAMYAKGALGSTRDDLASYSYQESEIWYTQSIETKNLIIEFHLINRQDAYSADENGILNSNKPMKALDKIVVYNRIEKMTNPNALPLQTIQFKYNYSLCQKSPGNLNTYNSSGNPSGKLTLEEIRVYNGDSYENALSSISFEYSENPPFSYANVDSWGQYKPNTVAKPNDIYPYTNQDGLIADASAKAWRLKAINNSLGGRIEIDYESDSYAYVQDKRAMRHFDIYRMTDLFDFFRIRQNGNWNGINRGTSGTMDKSFVHDYGSTGNFCSQYGIPSISQPFVSKYIFGKSSDLTAYTDNFGQFDINKVPKNVIIFKLDTPLNIPSLDQEFADKQVAAMYFKDTDDLSKATLTELFAKIYVKVKGDEDIYDLVPTMSKISDDYNYNSFGGKLFGALPERFKAYGAMPPNSSTGLFEYGYVIVDPVHTGKREDKGADSKKGSIAVHPMQLAALEYSRSALVDKVYGSDPDSEGDLTIDKKVFFGDAMYKYMIEAGYCNTYDKNNSEYRSLMRLNEPDYTKLGGGSRVKEIRYYDNWEQLSGEYDGHYSWRYTYTTTVNRGTYSTGVAAFEPMNMIDENPFNNWITYVNIRKKFPDENKFIPGPVDYQLYPKPVVGYGKVEVEFIEALNYGKTTSYYYTAKDYPTVSKATTIDKSARVKKNNIITGKVRENYGISQGYVTETNDFHGKLRMSEVTKKNAQNQPVVISKTVYDYYGKGEQVKMAERTGLIGTYNVAIEYDIHADSKYYTDENKFMQAGLEFVLNYTPPAFFYPTFNPVFNTSSRERAFYSHTLVKHINYSAVLKNVTTEYLGSVNTTKTTIFDVYTGAPVVSELTDEYNDKLYQVNYPSHWKYKELRELHEIKGRTATINLDATGHFLTTALSHTHLLTPGDIVFVDGYTLQVAQAWPWPEDGKMFLITPADGSIYVPTSTGNRTIQIMSSARNNRLSETMQSFTTKVNPATGIFISCPKDHILSASAITYRDRLSTDCACNNIIPGAQYNPYNYGMRGDLVLDKQFAWQSERSSDDPHGIRFDGAYRANDASDQNFTLFYEGDNSGNWNAINSSGHSQHNPANKYSFWRPLGNATLYDKYANPVEGKDQINVYSSVLTGFGDTYNALVVAEAVNAKKRQIAFDGFEDYQPLGADSRCRAGGSDNSHFDYYYDAVYTSGNGVSINTENKHSGLASLKVDPKKKASVSKKIIPTCYPEEIIDVISDKGIEMDSCSCLPSFSPTPGKYIVGAWVKDGSQAFVKIELAGGGTFTFPPEGPVIDGWRRVEGVFTIPPSGVSEITVTLENEHPMFFAFFDDLRIHPFLAGMQTTVYDPVTFLPMATHDGYNFTTYYNYDENLNLVRVRVETVEGIKTVMEQESGGQKTYISE